MFLPTVEEAVNFAAYHVSQKHMPATIENVIIGFEPEDILPSHFFSGESTWFALLC